LKINCLPGEPELGKGHQPGAIFLSLLDEFDTGIDGLAYVKHHASPVLVGKGKRPVGKRDADESNCEFCRVGDGARVVCCSKCWGDDGKGNQALEGDQYDCEWARSASNQ
jgi:hypothetical protein